MIQDGEREASIDIDGTRTFGETIDFGRTAKEYGRHRAGFPDAFFEELIRLGVLNPGLAALDIGTGTGTVARGMALAGAQVRALDPAPHLLEQARALDAEAGVTVDYTVGAAEKLGFDAAAFDLVTAGQCWHWFDRPKAAAECHRVLKPGGHLVIAHFDWIPVEGNVVAATEALIRRYNPAWTMHGGTGLYPRWTVDMTQAGFDRLRSFSFDLPVRYTHEDWRGRIQASAGVRASLDEETCRKFDVELAGILAEDYPDDPLDVPHRCWALIGRKP